MSLKTWVWVGVAVGSIIGAYVPALFGDSLLTFASAVGSTLGALVGIWVGYKIGQQYS